MPSAAALHHRELRRPNDDIYSDETFRRIFHSSRRMVDRVCMGLPDDLRLADEIPDRVLEKLQRHEILASDIVEAVCIEADITRADLKSERKNSKISPPRMLACWLMRRYTSLSTTEIGRQVNKDHTPVMHACKRIPELLEKPGQATDLCRRVVMRLGL